MLAADRSHTAHNRAATPRLGALIAQLGDAETSYLLGDRWAVGAGLIAAAFSAGISSPVKP